MCPKGVVVAGSRTVWSITTGRVCLRFVTLAVKPFKSLSEIIERGHRSAWLRVEERHNLTAKATKQPPAQPLGCSHQAQEAGVLAVAGHLRQDCHLHMRTSRHLRMRTSLVHARASTTSLVHAHTFWVGWVGWVG